MVTRPDLPEEILTDIFSRLPTKSIGRLRCLSKPWRSSLSTPFFIKSHLAQQKTRQQENLLLITQNLSIHSIETLTHDDNVSRNLDLPDIWSEFSGSCDGLVLLATEEFEKLLLNPITMEHMIIPNSPLALNSSQGLSTNGFGYDSLNDDYKVVTLSYYVTRNNDYDPECAWTHVDVYSMKNGVWKRVKVSPYNHTMLGLVPGAFINGALHWKASTGESDDDVNDDVIAAFDLAGEVFGEIAGPRDLNFMTSELLVLGGCLCMANAKPEQMDVWIMKEYGLVESWMKFTIYDPDCEWRSVKVLCFVGEEEVVWRTHEGGLVVYDRGDNTFRELVVDGLVEAIDNGGTFVESLVSPA